VEAGYDRSVERPARASAITFARTLRRTATAAERRLWRHLRNRGLGAFKIRRQEALGPMWWTSSASSAAW
jgi:very-short-patch-repair endonuclease